MIEDSTPTPSSFPGGPWLLEMFRQLNDRLSVHSKTMRDGFDKGSAQHEDLRKQLEAVAQDVALIKQARAIEAATVTRRSAVAGVVSGSGVIVLWEVVKHTLGWK